MCNKHRKYDAEVHQNHCPDSSVLLRRIYDALSTSLEGPSIAAAVLIIAKYQYQIAFVADQEINLLAALTEIMVCLLYTSDAADE